MNINEVTRVRLGQVNRGPAEAFMRDFAEISYENPFNSSQRVMDNAIIDLTIDGRGVHISDIRSTQSGRGYGSAAIQRLKALADKHDVRLDLFAKAYDSEGMDTTELIAWYQKLGFEITDDEEDLDYGAEMRYYPK